MLTQVGVNTGLISMAKVASNRAGTLGSLEDAHRCRMTHGVAVHHFFVQSGKLRVFLDDQVEIVPGQTAEQP